MMITKNVSRMVATYRWPVTDLIKARKKSVHGDIPVPVKDDSGVINYSGIWFEKTRNELVYSLKQEDASVVTIKVTGKEG